MRKILLTLALLFIPCEAWAACNGVFQPNTVCGNLGPIPAPPSAFSAVTSVFGPSSSTSGDVVVFGNTFGNQLSDTTSRSVSKINGTLLDLFGNNLPIVADGSVFTTQTSIATAFSIYSSLNSAAYFDTARIVTIVPSGSTVTNVSGVGSYLLNQNALVGANGAGILNWGIGISAVTSSVTWGAALQLQDSANNTPGADTGRGLNGFEEDFTVYNNGTVVSGPVMLLGGPTVPKAAVGFTCGGVNWTECFVSRNGASVEALAVGTTATSGTNVGSQAINFFGFNGLSNLYHATLSMFNHSFLFSDLTNVNGLEFDLSPTGSAPQVGVSCGDASCNLNLYAKGTGKVVSLFPFEISSITTAGIATTTSAGIVSASPVLTVPLSSYTIPLPTCNGSIIGTLWYVTNGVSPATYNAAVSSTVSGTTPQPVFCNGTNWTYH